MRERARVNRDEIGIALEKKKIDDLVLASLDASFFSSLLHFPHLIPTPASSPAVPRDGTRKTFAHPRARERQPWLLPHRARELR